MMELDNYDRAILNELQNDGRLSYAELGERIGLSKTPCWKRVQKLEQADVISGYRGEVNPRQIGLNLQVFLEVTIEHTMANEFEQAIAAYDCVIECFAISGNTDYLLSILTTDIEQFDELLRHKFPHLPGVQRLATTFCLRTIKSKGKIPIAPI